MGMDEAGLHNVYQKHRIRDREGKNLQAAPPPGLGKTQWVKLNRVVRSVAGALY